MNDPQYIFGSNFFEQRININSKSIKAYIKHVRLDDYPNDLVEIHYESINNDGGALFASSFSELKPTSSQELLDMLEKTGNLIAPVSTREVWLIPEISFNDQLELIKIFNFGCNINPLYDSFSMQTQAILILNEIYKEVPFCFLSIYDAGITIALKNNFGKSSFRYAFNLVMQFNSKYFDICSEVSSLEKEWRNRNKLFIGWV